MADDRIDCINLFLVFIHYNVWKEVLYVIAILDEFCGKLDN